MHKLVRVGAPTVMVVMLAGCTTGTRTAAPASSALATHSPTSSASPPASPTPSVTPMSFYAAQYLRIIKPSLDAQAALKALPDSISLAEAQPTADKLVKAVQAVNAELLRAQWPPKIEADIRADVTADGPLIGDFADLQSGSDRLVSDSGVANAAVNILRADLGLPPAS